MRKEHRNESKERNIGSPTRVDGQHTVSQKHVVDR